MPQVVKHSQKMVNKLGTKRNIKPCTICFWVVFALLLPILATPALACEKAVVALAPFLVSDPFLSDELAEKANDELSKRMSKFCPLVKILDQDLTRAAFDRVGISSYFKGPGRELTKEQVTYFAEMTGATHFAFSSIDQQMETITIAVYRIAAKGLSANPLLQWDNSYPEFSQNLPETIPFLNMIALLSPNSITYGAANTNIYFKAIPELHNVSETQRTMLPTYISSIGFTKIEHYRNYRLFDYGGSLFPRSFLFGIDQVSRFDKAVGTGEPPEIHYFHIQSYGGCGILSSEGAIHTPLGTTFAEIGVGLCLLQVRKEANDSLYMGSPTFTFGFGHRSFFRENWFVQVSIDTLNFSSALYKNRYVKASEIQRTMVGLGYYIPDSEHKFASAWGRILPSNGNSSEK